MNKNDLICGFIFFFFLKKKEWIAYPKELKIKNLKRIENDNKEKNFQTLKMKNEMVTSNIWNIGKYRYISTWILEIYRKYRINIDEYFNKNIDPIKMI